MEEKLHRRWVKIGGKKGSIFNGNFQLDSINQIEEYLNGVDFEDFIKRKLIQDGVIRQLEIIGEATKHLSPELREKYSNIPWEDIAGMRDKLIHHYFGVDLEAVWDTAAKDLPDLKENVKKILEKMG
jgi:uncharacterized protein with HEPN domain